jgi:hypothetical protein
MRNCHRAGVLAIASRITQGAPFPLRKSVARIAKTWGKFNGAGSARKYRPWKQLADQIPILRWPAVPCAEAQMILPRIHAVTNSVTTTITKMTNSTRPALIPIDFGECGIEQLELVGGEIRRPHPGEKARAVAEAGDEALSADVEDRARIADVKRECDERDACRPVGRKRDGRRRGGDDGHGRVFLPHSFHPEVRHGPHPQGLALFTVCSRVKHPGSSCAENKHA